MSKIQVNEIVNHFDNGAPDCPKGLTVTGFTTFSGSVSIGGTLTYEDVTNIDSVGVITARSGIHVTGVGSSVGIGTDDPNSKLDINRGSVTGLSDGTVTDIITISETGSQGNTGQRILFKNTQQNWEQGAITALREGVANNFSLVLSPSNGGSNAEALRITSAGRVGIGITNPQTELHLKTSGATGPTIRLMGTAPLSADSLLGGIDFFNNDGSGFGPQVGAYVRANAFGSGGQGGYLAFGTNDAATGSEGADATERLRIDSSGRLLVGTASAINTDGSSILQVVGTSSGGLLLARNDQETLADDQIGVIRFFGNDTLTAGGYEECAAIKCNADANHTDSSKASRLVFQTTASGAESSTERMRITSEGRFHVSNNTGDSLRYGNTINNSISSSSANQWALVIENNSDTSPFGLLIDFDDAAPDNTTNDFIRCTDSGATRMEVRSDGDVWTSDSGVLTSDATLKRDITDATPKLDDLMRLRVRNFYWTPEYHPNKQDKKLIGFIAQEVEEVFPGLVTHDNCISGGEPICDEEGNYTGEKTPEVLKKGLKEAKLVPILVKALQEAVERIETLEAKVTALEGA